MENIKKAKIVLLAAIMIVSLAASAYASVVGSKHDLSDSGPNASYKSASNTEICVYCHTPHKAQTTDNVPLWNKTMTTQTFTMYGTTIGGTAPASAPGGISKACLTCHDGVSAINAWVNAPGASASTSDATGFTSSVITGATTNIGLDLRDDHPISITYTAGRASLKATTAALTGWQGGTNVGAILRSGKIECSSCHDPHYTGTTPITFLRVSNTDSSLCLGCHDK